MTKALHTFEEVFDELGGSAEISNLTDTKLSTVSMWKAAKKFPPNTYVMITETLRSRGKTAPDALWSMRSAPDRETAA